MEARKLNDTIWSTILPFIPRRSYFPVLLCVCEHAVLLQTKETQRSTNKRDERAQFVVFVEFSMWWLLLVVVAACLLEDASVGDFKRNKFVVFVSSGSFFGGEKRMNEQTSAQTKQKAMLQVFSMKKLYLIHISSCVTRKSFTF
jgi:hypothetical protein